MGPAAGIDLYQKILGLTPATGDQSHMPTVLWSDPRVPDRTEFLTGKGPSPVPLLVNGVQHLVAAGVNRIAIACNTAHAFLPEINSAVPEAVFYNMIELASRAAAEGSSSGQIGILATTGTIQSELYQKALRTEQQTPLTVSDASQEELVMAAILRVKSGIPADDPTTVSLLEQAIKELLDSGAEVFLAACTELPLITPFIAADLRALAIDPTAVLAKAAVDDFLAVTQGA